MARLSKGKSNPRWSILFKLILLGGALCLPVTAPQAQVIPIPQGNSWKDNTRAAFYSLDQGSRIMPLAWLKAIKTPDGQPFLADKLARFGYLPNPFTADLPIGFTAAGPAGQQYAGMTCAACHTRQITVANQTYRIDGGPALSDLYALFIEMTDAVGRTLESDASFNSFAADVLGPNPTPDQVAALKADVTLWYLRENSLSQRALKSTQPWSLGRADAIGMIFNRLTGLDIGTAPSYLIEENIVPANAPVRYPFLWNAARQDLTQWPGFAPNGNDLFGLIRNLGEVYGVFGQFHPKPGSGFFGTDFLTGNSANFGGLRSAEGLIKQIGAPTYLWQTDPALVAQGKALFNSRDPNVNCVSCHGERRGRFRGLLSPTWATPLVDVGSDRLEYAVLNRKALSGVLAGQGIPVIFPRLRPTETANSLLVFSVIGSIGQKLKQDVSAFLLFKVPSRSPGGGAPSLVLQASKQAFNLQATPRAEGNYKYESRVLKGIWAAAPYLHNGSVPTLADLLKLPADRPASFAVGPNYDVDAVGLAATQPGSYRITTTGCEDINSGNSRCGHLWGTQLSDTDKKALVEYLKTL